MQGRWWKPWARVWGCWLGRGSCLHPRWEVPSRRRRSFSWVIKVWRWHTLQWPCTPCTQADRTPFACLIIRQLWMACFVVIRRCICTPSLETCAALQRLAMPALSHCIHRHVLASAKGKVTNSGSSPLLLHRYEGSLTQPAITLV